jgi:hypothetical protein
MTIGEVDLTGGLSVTRSYVLLSDLVGFRATQGSVESLLKISECDLFYCRFDDASGAVADRDPTNRRYPDPRRVDPEPKLRNLPAGKNPWRQPT